MKGSLARVTDSPDTPLQLPAALPPAADLRAAIQILEGRLRRVTAKHAVRCLGKLLVALDPTRHTAEETEFRAVVWIEACGDLNDELWSEATLACIQTSKWMPKPAEFRAQVEAKVDGWKRELKHCRRMLDGVHRPVSSEPFVPEPEDIRLRHLRDSLLRFGKRDRAAVWERQLASVEQREPEAWARQVPS